jgi:hypothetical protein
LQARTLLVPPRKSRVDAAHGSRPLQSFRLTQKEAIHSLALRAYMALGPFNRFVCRKMSGSKAILGIS